MLLNLVNYSNTHYFLHVIGITLKTLFLQTRYASKQVVFKQRVTKDGRNHHPTSTVANAHNFHNYFVRGSIIVNCIVK